MTLLGKSNPKVTNKKSTLRLYARWVPFAFIMPHVLVFLIFNMYPILSGIYASFTSWKLGHAPVWIGLENYYKIFVDQSSIYYYQLRWGMINTLKFVLFTVPLQICVPLFFAVILNTKIRGHKLFSSIIYLPSILSISVVMVAWKNIFDPSSGILNNMLGLGKVLWMSREPWNWIALVFITIWWCMGSNLIIYQSALASVPNDILEAASVDGANAVRRFFHITLPSIKFPLQYTLIASIVSQFGIWGQPEMFNDGGQTIAVVNGVNRESNAMIMQYIGRSGFNAAGSNVGIASAMALTVGIMMFAISIIQFRMIRRDHM